MQLLLKARGHQNGVVHRRAELHAADDGRRDEGDLRPDEVAHALVDENGQLDRGDEHHGDRERLEHDADDQQDRRDGEVVRHLEVHRRRVDQVAVHRALAGDHRVGIVLGQYRAELVELLGDLVGRGRVAGVDHHELIAPLLEHILDLVGNEEVGDTRAEHGVVGNGRGDAGNVLDALLHLAHVGGGNVVAEQDEVRGRHVVVRFELVVGDDARQGAGQRLVELIVDARVRLRVVGRQEQQHEADHQPLAVAQDEGVHLIEARQQALVRVLFDLPVKEQHERGHDENDGRDAEHNALGHHDTDVASERQAHHAQGKEARDGRQA